jgi:hypothetical protein
LASNTALVSLTNPSGVAAIHGIIGESAGFSLLLRGRSGDGVSAGIAFLALIACVPFFALRARRPRVTLRTFEATYESERCDERRYQSQEPHTSSSLIGNLDQIKLSRFPCASQSSEAGKRQSGK